MIKYEELEYCRSKVFYNADLDKVRSKRADILKQFCDLSKNTQVPGYRKGKAPPHIIRMTYRKQIEDALKRDMVSVAYDDIVFETKIKPIFYPKVQNVDLQECAFSCEMIFHQKPSFELGKYTGFELNKPIVPSKETLVDKSLQDLCVRHGELIPYGDNDFVQDGDKITIDLLCAAKPEANKEGMLYVVGSSRKELSDFDDNILGMAAGDERTFDVLEEPGVSDKKITLTVKVYMGVKVVPCLLDDALAEKEGCKDLAELRTKIEAMTNTYLKREEFNRLSQELIVKLLAEHSFVVPDWLVTMEAKSIASQNGLDWDKIDSSLVSALNNKATDQVKLSLILDSVKDQEPETSFSETELLGAVKQRIEESGQDSEKYLVEAQKNGQLLALVTALQHEAMLHWLINKSTILE